VKENLSKSTHYTKLNPARSNLFLNIIIILLAVIIIFMIYSLFTKVETLFDKDDEDNVQNAAVVIQVEVLNGCGATGVAEKFTSFLRQNNFDVVQTGNYFSFNIDNTLVIDRTGNLKNALRVAEALGINKKHVIQQKNDDYFLDVSLIIGKDYINLKLIN
jgi:hypothetical protein